MCIKPHVLSLATGESPTLVRSGTTAKVRVRAASLLSCIFLAACGSSVGSRGFTPEPVAASAYPSRSKADFGRVASRIQAATRSICAERAGTIGDDVCDFTFVLVEDPSAPPNAFQSRSRDGKPSITVNGSLLAQLGDDDELATVLSHEAAHHVAGHIDRMNDRTSADAFLPRDAGKNYTAESARLAQGRALELEADWIGAFISERSGYDPAKGSEIFARAAKRGGTTPGTSSHPDPTRRLEVVSAAVAEIGRQRSAGLTPRPENAPALMP